MAVVFGIVIFRMMLAQSRTYSDSSSTYYQFVPSISAAVLTLIVILILNFIYDYLAVFLTDMEYQRTQTEYDQSFTFNLTTVSTCLHYALQVFH